jgi:hypothetical protein
MKPHPSSSRPPLPQALSDQVLAGLEQGRLDFLFINKTLADIDQLFANELAGSLLDFAIDCKHAHTLKFENAALCEGLSELADEALDDELADAGKLGEERFLGICRLAMCLRDKTSTVKQK